ncbi:MAG TPA: hypothetical protein VFZ31_09045 [Vicinamibacterales bacterium]
MDHECSWTRRRLTELACDDAAVSGAGVPPSILRIAAASLGEPFSARDSTDDEYGKEISIGAASGSTHDECFFSLAPSTPALKRAMVEAVLRLQSHYLDAEVDWSQAAPRIVDELRPGRTLRLKASPEKRRVTLRCFDSGAGMLARRFAKPLKIDCSSGVARVAE